MEFTPLLKSLATFFKPSSLVKKSKVPLTVLILSPHPDDESIIGTLALRLALENNARIINVAVTVGSNKSRQAERIKELKNACKLLDMECCFLSENWKTKEKELKALILKHNPSLIIAPHSKDLHPTHIKTGLLLKKVLTSMKKQLLLVAWSEFWAPMSKPSLLVEAPIEILELQMNALQKHVGEISRNPYHLRLPAWMMDNVRRGSELLDGVGADAGQMAFGVLYQLQLFKDGKFTTRKLENKFLEAQCDIGHIFKLILDAASGSSTKVK
jgi:N-acetylglucosamine malate deacetylase 1